MCFVLLSLPGFGSYVAWMNTPPPPLNSSACPPRFQMIGGLVGRHGTVGDGEDYELAEPDEGLKR